MVGSKHNCLLVYFAIKVKVNAILCWNRRYMHICTLYHSRYMHLCSLLDRFLQQENSQGLYYGKYYPGNLDVLFQALDFKFNCIFRRYNVWTWSQWDIFDSSRCWIRMIGVVFPTYILYNSNSFESNYVSKNVRIGLCIFIVNTNTRKVKSYRKHIFDLIPNQLRNRT